MSGLRPAGSDTQGAGRFRTRSNLVALDGKTGEFAGVAASAGHRGPVRVRNHHHFVYADGAPHFRSAPTAAAMLGLEPLLARYPRQLSGGQRQQ